MPKAIVADDEADESVVNEAPAERSIRDELIAARDEYEEAHADETSANESANADRTRDERGRFVGKQQAAAGNDDEQAADESANNAAALPANSAGAAPVNAAPADINVPNSWSAAEKALWAKVPPEVRAVIQRREGDVAQLTSRMDAERELAREFAKATAPYEAILRAEGAAPMDAYKNFLNVSYVLRTGTPEQKLGLVRQALRTAGVDPRSLIQQPQPGQPPPAAIPPELQQEIQAMRQWRASAEQEKKDREQAELQRYQSEVDTFRADPSHPHFDAVAAEMQALLEAGVSSDLKDAYDRAVWSRPDLRSQLLAAQSNGQRQQQAVNKAKAKAVSVRGGPGGMSSPAPADRTLRQELEAAFAESNGRV